MKSFCRRARRQGKTIGFVPTMGYLHEGHLSLIRCCRRENDYVVASIFVNPSQFGLKEDFRRYPRNFKRDSCLAQEAGVDVLFCPRVSDIYPPGYRTYVIVEDLSQRLCGAFRPGHFRGVATVVLKLFNIIGPQRAYFGQKDAQQAVIIDRMKADLNLGVKIRILPIVRGRSGLALSSRNSYLNRQQTEQAAILYKALQTAVGMVKSGQKDPRKITARMRKIIKASSIARIQYIRIVDLETLKQVKRIKGNLLIALACFFKNVRLIDNVILKV